MTQHRATRHAHRFEVQFWEPGADKKHLGYTTNISTSGMFVTCRASLPVGTRLRVEVSPRGRGFLAETEVARVLKVPEAMRHVEQPGLGLRFLPIADLVETLLPRAGAGREPVRPMAPSSPASPTAGRGRSGVAGDPAPGPAPPLPSQTWFRVEFPELNQFLQVLERDIANGGLFIRTERTAEVQEIVIVDLVPPGANQPMRYEARVVHCLSPQQDGSGTVNLLAGIGVEFLEGKRVLRELREAADQWRGRPS